MEEIQRSEKNFCAACSFGGTFESEQPPNANSTVKIRIVRAMKTVVFAFLRFVFVFRLRE